MVLSVNFRRGLFRSWIVLSLLWIGYNGVFAVTSVSRDATAKATDLELRADAILHPESRGVSGLPLPDKAKLTMQADHQNRREEANKLRKEAEQLRENHYSIFTADYLLLLLAVMISPPLILLVAGRIGFWVLDGFSSQ